MKNLKFYLLTIVLGTIATLVMDIGNFVFFKLGFINQIDEIIIARLIIGWSKFQFIFENPSLLPNVENAQFKGTIFHYGIGIIFAYCFILILKLVKHEHNTMIIASIYGVLTSAISLCLLFPSLGLGFLGLKAGNQLLISSLINHFIYGIGLGIGFFMLKNKFLELDGENNNESK